MGRGRYRLAPVSEWLEPNLLATTVTAVMLPRCTNEQRIQTIQFFVVNNKNNVLCIFIQAEYRFVKVSIDFEILWISFLKGKLRGGGGYSFFPISTFKNILILHVKCVISFIYNFNSLINFSFYREEYKYTIIVSPWQFIFVSTPEMYNS